MPNNKKQKTASPQGFFHPSTETILNIIRTAAADDLLELVEEYEDSADYIKKCYYHPELTELWDEIVANPTTLSDCVKFLPSSPFQQQPGLHSFDFIAGYCYYRMGKNVYYDPGNATYIINELDHMELLSIAEKHYSYHATVMLAKLDLENLPTLTDTQKAEKAIKKVLQKFETLRLHGTPGYVYISKAYLSIITFYQKKANENEVNIKNAWQLAVQNAQTALLLEPNCSEAINNAYFGAGIETGLIINDTVNFNDLPKAVDECCKFAVGFIGLDAIAIAKQAAEIEASNFISRIYPEIFELKHKPVK